MVATTLVLLCTKPIHVSWAAGLPWLIPVPSTAIIGREVGKDIPRDKTPIHLIVAYLLEYP